MIRPKTCAGPSHNNAALHGALYQQISSSSDEAIKVALGLVDEADKAAQKMVAECETLLAAVRKGTEQIRSELREKMVEFATVMRDYSEEIAAKTEPMSRRRATPPT